MRKSNIVVKWSLTVLAVMTVVLSIQARAASYGLVVGIDHYQHIPSLEGAVNDATDIAASLREAGFEDVYLLTDEDANRNAILAAWRLIMFRAKPGDTVVFTYAGHGGQETERVAGSEQDAKDEVFMLSGFEERRPGNGERILDDEIYGMFSNASQFNIVFVADSCHSGTMTRSFDLRSGAGKSRLASYGPIEDDELPAITAPQPLEDNMENVTFFGAVEDNQVVNEFSIEGRPRGAMSWAFARAMRGAADRDGNLRLSTKELEIYLRETVRTQTEGRQVPRMAPRGRSQRDVITLTLRASDTFNDEPLRIFGLDPTISAPSGSFAVTSAAEADIIWDAVSGEVINATGDVVARLGKNSEAKLNSIVTKWQALRIVRQLAERHPLSAILQPDSSVHHEGEFLDAIFADPAFGNLIMFNLANDGTLQLIAPGPDPNDPRYNGKISSFAAVHLPAKVTPPFGMDHVVAIVSPEPLVELIDTLNQNDGRAITASVLNGLKKLQQLESIQAAIVSILTEPRT